MNINNAQKVLYDLLRTAYGEGVCNAMAEEKGLQPVLKVAALAEIMNSREAFSLIEPMAKGEAVACQYALDVAMPEYRCVGKCQYDTHPQPAESGVSEAEMLREAIRSIYEVYAGSEGFIPETAAEGYMQSLVKKMADIAREHLSKRLAPESREDRSVLLTNTEHAALQAELEAFRKSDLESTRREMAAIVHVADLSERLRKAERENEDMNELLSSVPVEAIKRGMLEMQIEHRRLQAQVNYLNNPTITMQQNEGSLADMLAKLEAFLTKLAAHKGDKA